MNTIMHRKYLILALILTSAGLLLMTSSIAVAQSNEFAVPLSDPAKRGKLKAHLNYGSITVKGSGRKDILVKYTSGGEDREDDRLNIDVDVRNGNRKNDDEKPSRDGLKRIAGSGMDLEVTETNNTVNVVSNSWSHRMNLEIEIPSGMDVELHTYNGGDLMITNVQGEVSLSNYNGEITALNIAGSVVASTYNGEIKATFDKVAENTPMSFSTYNGDIDLTFPSTLKATLKMKTEQGEILTGFDVNLANTGPVQMKDSKGGVYKVVVDDWKRGDVNGGGPEFTMKNYNGDILIRKK